MMRRLLVFIAGLALSSLAPPPASAQSYPAKPIRLIVPWAPGGTTDILGRIIGQKMSENWGQPVVIDNRGGAAGNIGSEAAARSPADGYTLLLGTMSTHAMNQFLYARMSYDPVNDLAPISLVANVATVLVVHPSLPVKNVNELIALAKARPGQLNFASGGIASFNQLCAELLKLTAKIDIVHVPYKGGGPAVADLVGGKVEMLFTGAPVTMSHIKSGRLKLLAVTDSQRSAALADTPTVGESLPGYEFNNWYGMMAPAGTPRPVIERLNSEILRILALSDVRERFIGLGADPTPSTPERFGAVMKADAEKWGRIIRESGVRAD
ncbi:MAG: tripartite tricarboxylate transporter substrate binding protein [Betaproteobacteria bacterium]|nr:tripartite tricarboxylate transporter substrate binding protein [Betaproteobacteria bacterium]